MPLARTQNSQPSRVKMLTSFEELLLNRDYTEASLRAVSGHATVPQIFIDGEYIGGSEALESYLQSDKAA